MDVDSVQSGLVEATRLHEVVPCILRERLRPLPTSVGNKALNQDLLSSSAESFAWLAAPVLEWKCYS